LADDQHGVAEDEVSAALGVDALGLDDLGLTVEFGTVGDQELHGSASLSGSTLGQDATVAGMSKLPWAALTSTDLDGQPNWVVRPGQKTAHRVLFWSPKDKPTEAHTVCNTGLGRNWRQAERGDRQCSSCS
jgi:hypothetical protein